MAGANTAIIANDYNAIQSKIANVLGTGSQDFGYGQSVSSSQVARDIKITVDQWNALRNDLLKARQHQTGVNEGSNLITPTNSTTIKEIDRYYYNAFSDLIVTNRLICNEATVETLHSVIRTAQWGSTITQTVTITFSSSDAARYFFNAGGKFQFSSTFKNYTSDGSLLVNQSWETLLDNMRTISFGAYATTTTGTGTPQPIGFYNLTSTNQLVFTKLVEPGNQYSPNQYDLYARISGPRVIFTPTWSYTSSGHGPILENANGTLTSLTAIYRPSGSNVSIPAPNSSTTNID